MIIYVDITQLESARANTGIQRVVKEFVKRAALSTTVEFKMITFDEKDKQAFILDNAEIGAFLENMKDYKFNKSEKIDILNFKPQTPSAFFDLDSTWNIIYRRSFIYPALKSNGFLIFNFIHDIIPILFPEIVHDTTKANFIPFLQSVYDNSDLVLFNSFSSQKDFLNARDKFNTTRDIPTRVTGLGSDFLHTKTEVQDPFLKSILEKKYILFVGTVEPRKNQADVLEAFEILAEKYEDLNLVFIGKPGWKNEQLLAKINTHELKDKQLFLLSNVDDNALKSFYENAFLVTYLSKYEGYGLPIAESLGYGNITITSKNSSMYEVGKNIADYVVYNSLNELKSLISLYYEDKELYDAKKLYIKENFKTTSWDQFYNSISDVFANYEKSIELKKDHLKSLQFVFISIDKHNLEGTIKSIDENVDFVKEYIVVTAPKYVDEFKTISSKHTIKVIDERDILKSYADSFSKRDHVSKNWLLRASLLNIESLEEEFIMLDDDNRALKKITLDKFIAKDGSYNAYYFYNMLEWHYQNSEFDVGQETMRTLLAKENYEMLMYSSHAPQIINKKIFKEVVDKFFDIGLKSPIDEWSTYFNYAVSLYPCAFNKKVFQTLSWPATPTDWETTFLPDEYSFENYYKALYDTDFFDEKDSYEQKVEKKQKQLQPYLKSKQMFKETKDIWAKNNLVHETLLFKKDDVKFYLSNIPYFLVVESDSDIKIRLNFKLLNPSKQKLDLAIVLFLDGGYRTLRDIKVKNLSYEEDVIEVPVVACGLKEGIYDISFNIMLNNEYIYSDISPYSAKLLVVKDKELSSVLGNPQLIEPELPEKVDDVMSLKNKIKSIPFFGWLARWSYNILRLNNTKHRVYKQQQAIVELQRITEELRLENLKVKDELRIEADKYKLEINNHKKEIEIKDEQIMTILKSLQDDVKTDIAKQISYQSDSFQQRLDQFIFDTKIELKIKDEKDD